MDPEQYAQELGRGIHRLTMLVDYQEQHIRELERRNGELQMQLSERAEEEPTTDS